MTTTDATADFPLDDNIPATASKEMHANDSAAEASVLLPIPLDDDVSPSTTAEVSRYDITKTPDPADLSSATPNELQLPHSSRSDAAVAVVSNQCELCANYEEQLQLMQEKESALRLQLAAAQHLSDRYQTELSGERVFRTELETKMNALVKDCTVQVNAVNELGVNVKSQLDALRAEHAESLQRLQQQLHTAVEARKSVDRKCARLHTIYQDMLSCHQRTADAMRAEPIDLPQTVDELHVHCLQLREQLIDSTASREHTRATLENEIVLLREALSASQTEREQVESQLTDEVNELRLHLATAQSYIGVNGSPSHHHHATGKPDTPTARPLHIQETGVVDDSTLATYQQTVAELEKSLMAVQKEKNRVVADSLETRRKLQNLQHELDTSESVQRDFVKLSQELQMKLEKIRQAEEVRAANGAVCAHPVQEVRWQFDEDVYACNQCSCVFAERGSGTVKLHCRHCGRIFCDECLANTVVSGANKRQARVCTLCHTLLCRDRRPYFSEDATSPVNDNKTNHQVKK